MNIRRLATVFLLIACAAARAAAPLPGDSIYQLAAPLTNQDGQVFHLADQRGHPVVVSMFYNSCEFVCPMMVETIRMTEQALTPEQRRSLKVMLISFDPKRDTVAVLKSVAVKRELEGTHWTVARADEHNVRKIAAALDIQYRQLANGEFNHSTALVLLDADGRVLGRTSKMGAVDPGFVKLIKEACAKTP